MEWASSRECFVLADIRWSVFALRLPCWTCSGDGKSSSFLDCPFSTLCSPKPPLETRSNVVTSFPRWNPWHAA